MLGGVDSLAVEASFSEADVAPIKIGQAATVTLANHPGVTYKATVTQIDPAGTTSGSLVKYGVQLAFTTPPAGLLLGQSANVAVTTDPVDERALRPDRRRITRRTARPTVTVQNGTDGSDRHGDHGLNGDQGTEITSGLTEGQMVVVTN